MLCGTKRVGFVLCGMLSFMCGMAPAMTPSVWLVQQQAPPQTVKAQLFKIEGHGQSAVYTLRDAMGRFHRLRVDAQTKRDRPLVPGEWVEVQMSPDGRALSIQPAK